MQRLHPRFFCGEKNTEEGYLRFPNSEAFAAIRACKDAYKNKKKQRTKEEGREQKGNENKNS